MDERCMNIEVRFCSPKGDPLWVRTFPDSENCLLLQVRKNFKGCFIVLMQYQSSSRGELSSLKETNQMAGVGLQRF